MHDFDTIALQCASQTFPTTTSDAPAAPGEAAAVLRVLAIAALAIVSAVALGIDPPPLPDALSSAGASAMMPAAAAVSPAGRCRA